MSREAEALEEGRLAISEGRMGDAYVAGGEWLHANARVLPPKSSYALCAWVRWKDVYLLEVGRDPEAAEVIETDFLFPLVEMMNLVELAWAKATYPERFAF